MVMNMTDKLIISHLKKEISLLNTQINQLVDSQNEQLVLLNQLLKTVNDVKKNAKEASGNSAENIWANVFNSTISRTTWLEDKKFSPGRWAAGYAFLYALYRTLDEFRPHSILELGLGQTTKMISQYAAVDKSISHTVVEHDENWVNFYKKSNPLSSNTNIFMLPMTTKGIYKEDTEVYAYEGFKEKFSGKKYDLISIDAPFGGYAKIYARVDIISILPDCLADSFVIFIDDSNRKGEQKTIMEIKDILKSNNIDFCEGEYKGQKYTKIITSEDIGFLCSM